MRPIRRDDLLTLEAYERHRDAIRARMMAHKDTRRLAVGAHLTLRFEDRVLAWYQVQEMLRAERIFTDAGIQGELDAYNELIPGEGELSATLFVEYADPAVRDQRLRELAGLEERLALHAGDQRIAATFDPRQVTPEKLSAVQFLRFAVDGVDPAALPALAEADQLAVGVDHPAMQARGPIPLDLARALSLELAGRAVDRVAELQSVA